VVPLSRNNILNNKKPGGGTKSTSFSQYQSLTKTMPNQSTSSLPTLQIKKHIQPASATTFQQTNFNNRS